MAKNRNQAEQVADAIIKGHSNITERDGQTYITFTDGSTLTLKADQYTRFIVGREAQNNLNHEYTALTTR